MAIYKNKWQPQYTITPSMASNLMEIEAARVVVDNTHLPQAVQETFTREARIRTTHYSTHIDGNRFTFQETKEVIASKRRKYHGRERDITEVKNYLKALIRVEEWASKERPITEGLIRRIHSIVINGSRPRPVPYRGSKAVVHDPITGGYVHLSAGVLDIPKLMANMILWINKAERENVPAAIIAALVHHQFINIQPYNEGNGRTARLFTTYILYRSGYSMKGCFSMEEYLARDLNAYCDALNVGSCCNYYEGNVEEDLTGWLVYFISTLASAFIVIKDKVIRYTLNGTLSEPEKLRKLDHRARMVMRLFSQSEVITSKDVARALGLSEMTVRVLMKDWIDEGWLVMADPSKRARSYALAEEYRQYSVDIPRNAV